MTGYASAQHTPGGNAEIATPAACLALELRSVNSRFLDVVLRLPDELRPQEPALRELIAKRLKRGKVELRISVEAATGGALPDVPVRTLQRLAAAQQQVRVWLPEAAPLSVADALRLAAGDSAASPALGEALLPLARQALDELVAPIPYFALKNVKNMLRAKGLKKFLKIFWRIYKRISEMPSNDLKEESFYSTSLP